MIIQFNKVDLGHLNFIRATYVCQSLARMGHQLSKLNDIPVYLPWMGKGYLPWMGERGTYLGWGEVPTLDGGGGTYLGGGHCVSTLWYPPSPHRVCNRISIPSPRPQFFGCVHHPWVKYTMRF